MKKLFYNQIKNASKECDIEAVYKENLKFYFNKDKIEYPFRCDGYLEDTIMYDEETKVLRLIMEFKYGLDFNNNINRAKVLMQVIFYLKQFTFRENKKYIDMPNVILAGDKTTCFIISSSEVKKYLTRNIDWNIPPSDAPSKYKSLVDEISMDKLLNPIIFNIDKEFKFDHVVRDIKRLIIEIKFKFKVTESNISETYDYFIERIIMEPHKYLASDLVQSFIDVILGNVEISYKKGQSYIAKKDKRIPIDSYNYGIFQEEYSVKYSIEDKNKFIAIKDRLTEDTIRRFNGEFFTPTIWVNEVHKQLEKVLGLDWKEKYVVWDCAWGTGNLTRDYYFDNLYCSTIDEVDISLGEQYNKNSEKFVFDFLNDNLENIPKELFESFNSNKKIIFFINPPFGESSNGKQLGKKIKKGISKTKIKEWMYQDGYKDASQQLYIQFLYRILKIKNRFNIDVSIGVFLPTLFLAGERARNFRDAFLNDFKFEMGIVFNASDFSNVSKEWGVGFTIWTPGKTINKKRFNFKVMCKDNKGAIIGKGEKIIYNVDRNEMLSSWIRGKSKKDSSKIKIIKLKSALNNDIEEKEVDKDAMGFLMNDSNVVYANSQGVYILSAPVKRHIKTTVINKNNYKKCFSLYSARKIIKTSWLNQKDNYCIPNIKNPQYIEWEKDCIIYSIFTSGVTSLRNIKVKDRIYNIKNEMFFMSIDEIKQLANINNNEDIYWDCKMFSNESLLYLELKSIELSGIGRKVFEQGKKLIKNSFVFRDEFNRNFPEYNINTWDAGWYQVKKLLSIYMKSELESFNDLLKDLENKMKPMIYELGFLKIN